MPEITDSKNLDDEARELELVDGRNLADSFIGKISRQLLNKAVRSKADLDYFMKGIELLSLPSRGLSIMPCGSACSGTEMLVLCMQAH